MGDVQRNKAAGTNAEKRGGTLLDEVTRKAFSKESAWQKQQVRRLGGGELPAMFPEQKGGQYGCGQVARRRE